MGIREVGGAVKVKWIRRHVEGCYAAKNWKDNPWAYFIEKAVYLDAIGRTNSGGRYRWLQARCNDFNCSGLVIVRECDLLKLVQKALQP